MDDPWLTAVRDRFCRQKAIAERAVEQLSDEELHRRPAPGFNSVAVILRHMSGNLRSRFTDFLTTDGEKPDRDREHEFDDWTGTRAELLIRWNDGWRCLFDTIDGLPADYL